MKKETLLIIFVAIIFSLTIAFSSCPALAEAKYKVTFGHVEPVHTSIHVAAEKIKELIEMRTKGKFEILVHPASELGSGPDQGQMIQSGAIQMAILPGGHIAGIFPEVQVFAIPFMFPSSLEEAAKIINGPAAEKLFSYMGKIDLVGLAVYPHAHKQFTSNKPIKVPSDFKGQKIRTMAAPIIVESYKLLGASPTPINYYEVYSALQLGTVDGQENPFWSIGVMKFYEVQKYIVESNHALFVTVFIVNKNWFESLPENYQKIIREVAQEVVPFQIEYEAKIDNEWKEKIMQYKDITVTKLTPEAQEAFKQKLAPVKEVYVKLVGASGKESLEAFEKAMAK